MLLTTDISLFQKLTHTRRRTGILNEYHSKSYPISFSSGTTPSYKAETDWYNRTKQTH